MATPEFPNNNNDSLINFSDSSSSIDMREKFFRWLSDGNTKKFSPQVSVTCIDEISEYVISKKISCGIWEIFKPSVFKSVFQKVMDAKLLRINEPNTYKVFTVVGRLYSKFLKEKPWKTMIDLFDPNVTVALTESLELTGTMTIKDAAIKVMSDTKHPMTVKEIYDEIIKQGLYTFGAQNPINVVRNIIDSACDNSGYSEKYKTTTLCFHSEKIGNGKRVYSILRTEQAESGEDIVDDENKSKQPIARIKTPVNESVTEEIFLPNGRKCNVDDVIDLDEAQSEMDNILRAHFMQLYGYSNKRLLFEAVRIALPMFLNDNGFNDEDTVLAVAKHLLGSKYVFHDLHIWQNEPDYPKSVSGLVVGLGKANGGIFTAEDAANYLKKVKIPQYLTNVLRINNGKEAFVLCDEGKIVLAEYLNLSEERVTSIFTELRKLFSEEGVIEVGYVIPRDITVEWFDRLPNLDTGLEWTPLLLQEIIARYPKYGIKVVFSGLTGQSIYTVAPAFVAESSMLYTFADVVHLYLLRKQDFALSKKMPAENLRLILREAGMLTGNEMIYNLHKVLGPDHRFAFSENNQTVFIRER